ncbi:alanine--tRNA ligase [Candidatus Berkelbacteria bacterium]|nr:alanine--tRNA ligase [Candidatus Berkelbacteria bacterium]
MTRKELIERFFAFYQERGHAVIGQAPLVPAADTSVLFTTAGMHPLIPYLLGDAHPDGTRLVNVQRSLRTTDIEAIGDATHATCFEMLGHWSLGDYWKREAIEWSYQFVTDVLGFAPDNLAATIFQGDPAKGIDLDEEAKGIWESIGVARIAPLGEPNFWGPVHATGPCGPTTEIFVHVHPEVCGPECLPGSRTDDHWVEIWNNVFMEYDKTADGTYVPLTQKNIDTGVGLERVLMTVAGQASIYETDPYQPLVAAISPDELAHADRDVRIIADHVKAAVFLIGDGVLPSNKDRGYVLRRLIRRAVAAARRLGTVNWETAVEAVITTYGEDYSHLVERGEAIHQAFEGEQSKFSHQLGRATQFLHKALEQSPHPSVEQAAELAFLAYQSHALPLEASYELLGEHGVSVGEPAFNAALDALVAKHKAVSAEGQEKKFGGHGLILDTGELKAGSEEELAKVLRLHTATHLLQAGLRHVLGDHVQQKGSDITAERLRFDFTHPEKVTDEQKQQVEDWVNDVIRQDLPMQFVELPLEEAKQSGALHFFGHKYPQAVKVYFAGNRLDDAVSKEFCGGPHVTHTGEIGTVKITKEQSAAAGVRRIKAVVE